MPEQYISLIAGFVGAIIGAAASIITVWIQSKSSERRARLQTTAKLAFDDYKEHFAAARRHPNGARQFPVVAYLHYHASVMELLESGQLSAENLRRLHEENTEIIEAIDQMAREGHA